MKAIRLIVVIFFSAIIMIPILNFNFTSGAVSEIDNRMLTENPFSDASLNNGGDLSESIQNYVNDRIGLRDEMILTYTVLNDRVFGKMVHPSYEYGKDGDVFGAGITTSTYEYSDFHEAFADMVKEIQDYCNERNIPFLFVFNPAKPAVLSAYLPDGVNYDREWVSEFLTALDERNVNYIDNTKLLIDKTANGEVVFNKKYDANHWNDLGAYYGTNAILEELKKDLPTVHVNGENDIIISEKLETTLPVSKFPINEMVPQISINADMNREMTSMFDNELERNVSYSTFGYYQNHERVEEGAPKALVFQGSYMNKFGYKYLANGFGEYIYIHDYQNILNFDYYFNIFQPDCVIFEVAEYTFSDSYFNYERMKQFALNPRQEDIVGGTADIRAQQLDMDKLQIDIGETLTTINWITEDSFEYVWINLDNSYDMSVTDGGYKVTVTTEVFNQYKEEFNICAGNGDIAYIFE